MNPPSDDLHRQIPLELALALSGNFNLQATAVRLNEGANR